MEKNKIIILSGASADGKVSVAQKSSSKEFGKALTKRMSEPIKNLRSWCDIVIVGRRTILFDNPNLINYLRPGASRGIIDRFLQLDYKSGFQAINKDFPLFIFTTKKPDKKLLKQAHIRFVILEKDNFFVGLKEYLNKVGMKKILFEAGGNLCSLLLKNKIADEINIAFFPFIIGGPAPTLCDGGGIKKIENRINLELVKLKEIDGMIQIKYKINNK